MRRLVLAVFLLMGTVCAGRAFTGEAPPHVIYTKSFPGSTPAYIEIAIEKNGAGLYKEDPKDEDPLTFQLGDAETAMIWDLTARLANFGKKLESGLKVANMGHKTLHYEGPDGVHEAKFNYSTDPDAKTLNDLFEQIAETERAYGDLERAVRFDKLGVQNALLRVEVLRDQKRLVPQSQVLPLLDRVAGNEAFLHMARERAATLADTLRQPK